jgi:hypothetical protein
MSLGFILFFKSHENRKEDCPDSCVKNFMGPISLFVDERRSQRVRMDSNETQSELRNDIAMKKG